MTSDPIRAAETYAGAATQTDGETRAMWIARARGAVERARLAFAAVERHVDSLEAELLRTTGT